MSDMYVSNIGSNHSLPWNQFLSWTAEDVEASYFSFFSSLFLNSSSSGKRHSSSP